jgi:glycosyltransferase involved in cell wall biosynthesis
VLAVLPQLIPSTWIGVVKPLLALHRQRRIVLDVAVERWSWIGRGRLAAADLVVFCRNTEPRHGAVLEDALRLGTPIIYELDDDFFSLPAGIPGSDYHRDPARLAQLERYLRGASLVRVYSEALRARVAAVNPRVHRVDALVDWDLVPATPPPRSPGPLRIVYATSRRVDSAAAIFMPDLRRVLDARRGSVEAWFLGYRPTELLGRADVHVVDFVEDYDVFFRRFARSGFQIGLAPLPDEAFYRAKSDNKFREYAACGIAGIYSDVVVYRDCVDHGRTGLLVPDVPGAWFAAMVRLIEDDALRSRIQREAGIYARGRYGLRQAAQAWLAQIEALRRRPGTPAPSASGRAGGGGLPDAVGRRRATPRIGRVLRRTAGILRGRRGPGVPPLPARIGWHVRSLRALMRLQWELRRTS